MSDELFPAESLACDSPRLAWIKRHQIRRHRNPQYTEGDECAPWCAWLPSNDTQPGAYPEDKDMPGGVPRDPEACGYGHTEDEALAELARIAGLWNEEGAS